jgi:hypothetical protein
VTTEVIERISPARVGFAAVEVPASMPKIITAGEYAEALKNAALAKADVGAESSLVL